MAYLYNNPDLKIRRRTLRGNMPQPERILWYHLKGKGLKGHKFRRQYGVGAYVIDFYCPALRLAIEIDGDSHFSSTAEIQDKKREAFLKQQNIRILRFTNTEVTENAEEVLNKILGYLP